MIGFGVSYVMVRSMSVLVLSGIKDTVESERKANGNETDKTDRKKKKS
ncbi:MAG: hypothetical protein ACLUGO_08115 [Mediterraneibacter faecis]